MNMKVFKSLRQFQEWRKGQRAVNFVPTMGALHAGHMKLVKQAQKDSFPVVVSIFVNPTQFNSSQDLKEYPRPLARDLMLLRKIKVDAVFLPTQKMLYPDGFKYKVIEEHDSRLLCGAHRAGHFTGVLTVVLKLLNIVRPEKAFFGEKDYQQFHLIQGMAESFFLETQIVPVATVRESSGLALSSRNELLSPRSRKAASKIWKFLSDRRLAAADVKKKLFGEGFEVDYVEDHWNRRFVAAYLDRVRLIDNVPLNTGRGKSS